MSTPVRELPPLNVRIQGDERSFTAAIARAQSQAQAFQSQINAMVFTPRIAPIRAAVRMATRAAIQVVTRNVQDVGRQVAQIQMSSRVPANARRAMRTTLLALITGAVTAVNNVSGQLGAQGAFARYARTQLRAAVRSAIRGVAQATTAAITAGVNGINAAALTRQFQGQLNRALTRSLARLANGIGRGPLGPMPAGRGRGRGGGGGGEGFGGIGSRADIYMHQRGIQHLVGYVSGLAAIGTEFQNMEIKIGAFTNSAQEAKKAMADLKEESITSPHSIKELGDATTKMLGYGLSMQQTVAVRKQLQDVAGGDDETFSKLARGISQIVTLGKLQGDEMNQLAEHGFNPLATMAKHMTKGMGPEAMIKKYKELDTAKRAGKITSDMVLAALKLETSAGGHFAGLSDKLAQSVSGLSKQIKNVAMLIADLGFNAIKDDLEGVLRYVLANIKAWREWAVNNKEAVKEIAKNAIALIGAIAAFHVAGFAIALISWNLRTLRGLLILLTPLQWAWSIVTGACAAAMFLWTTATSGWIGATVVAIGLILGIPLAIGAISLAIWNLRKGFNLAGFDLKNFAAQAEGFFWNISHNSKVMSDYIKENFDALTKYLKDVFSGMFSALPKNLIVALRVGMELLGVWADALGKMLQFKMGKILDQNLFGGLRTPQEKLIREHESRMAEKRLTKKALTDVGAHFATLMEKESKNLTSGFEGVKYEGKSIEGLKFTSPDWANFPKGEPKPLPPAEDPDFMKMLGAGNGKNKGGLSDAPRYQSGDHAKQIYADTERMQARAAGVPKKEDKQAEANRILKAIERNTRAGEADGNKFLIETALGGVNQ